MKVAQLAIADRQLVAGRGADEGGDRGDHEERRADLVDDRDPPAEVGAAAARPVAVHLGQGEVAGDEEEHAADDFRRPDEAVHLGGGEVADQRRQQAGAEVEGADEEGDGARPVEPPRLSRPPAPLGPHHPSDRPAARSRPAGPRRSRRW